MSGFMREATAIGFHMKIIQLGREMQGADGFEKIDGVLCYNRKVEPHESHAGLCCRQADSEN
jgi:hypothetical protein